MTVNYNLSFNIFGILESDKPYGLIIKFLFLCIKKLM